MMSCKDSSGVHIGACVQCNRRDPGAALRVMPLLSALQLLVRSHGERLEIEDALEAVPGCFGL